MSALYVILAIVAVLGLVAGQMVVLRYKWMEYAAASLQARAMRPRVLARTLLSFVLSTVFFVVCCLVVPPYPRTHWSIIGFIYCVPVVIFYSLVHIPPVTLIATFGPRMSRVLWSLFFGVLVPLIVFLSLEFLQLYASGIFQPLR
jgi:hypothetical protein